MAPQRHQRLGRRLLLTLGIMACAGAATGAQDSPARHPVPGADALAQTERVVREVYGAKFQAATSPSKQTALAREILAHAGENRDEPAAQYYLLHVAKNIAVEAGDTATALEAADRLARTFQVDGLKLKLDAVQRLQQSSRFASAKAGLAAAALDLVDEVLAADDLEAARRLTQVAVTASRASRDRDLARRATDCDTEMQRVARMHAECKKALEVLDTSPADPKANLAAGRFACLIQGRWERGIPMLALGGDAALAATAQKDLKRPVFAEDQLALADAWWKLADGADGRQQKSLMLRAGAWYKLARPGTPAGLARVKIDKRLEEIRTIGRPIPAPGLNRLTTGSQFPQGQWVDVLKGVDLDWDSAKGSWKRSAGAVLAEPEESSRLLLPVVVEGGYDLEVKFTRTTGNGDVQVFLPANSAVCHLALSAYDERLHALAEIDGQFPKDNPTVRRPGTLTNGRQYTVLAAVRPQDDSVTISISLDGEPLIEWSGKQSSLSTRGAWYWPVPNQPGLGAYRSTVTFHSARLRLVSGGALLWDTGGTRAKRYERSRCHGGDWGVGFYDLGPPGSILVGFHFARRDVAKHPNPPLVLDGMQPVYRTPRGLMLGHPYEGEGIRLPPVVAKEGYAVGGMVLKAGADVDGMRLLFMRVQGDRLDPNDSYQSEWFGGRGGAGETKLGGDGRPIAGIYGNKRRTHASLGLILPRERVKQEQKRTEPR